MPHPLITEASNYRGGLTALEAVTCSFKGTLLVLLESSDNRPVRELCEAFLSACNIAEARDEHEERVKTHTIHPSFDWNPFPRRDF